MSDFEKKLLLQIGGFAESIKNLTKGQGEICEKVDLLVIKIDAEKTDRQESIESIKRFVQGKSELIANYEQPCDELKELKTEIKTGEKIKNKMWFRLGVFGTLIASVTAGFLKFLDWFTELIAKYVETLI